MSDVCPNKELCGSCGWSHIPYEEQLKQKLADINGSFKLKELNLQCDEILPSRRKAHYRNRMDFVIDFEGRVGLRQKGKWWRVIDDHHCFISDEKIEKLFKETRAWTKEANLSFYDRKSHEGFLRYAVIRASAIGQTALIIVTSSVKDSEEEAVARAALKELAKKSGVTTLVWSINSTITDVSFGDKLETISGPGFIEEEINGIIYRISPHAFFQTNSYTAPLLLDTVCEFAGDLSDKVLLDLYCGTGFFATALAAKARQTSGVEISEAAVADAVLNAERNKLDIKYFDAKTEDFDWQSIGADTVILDPPRSGMHDKALKDVIRIKPPVIVYVSCNHKHFAREMVELKEYYKLEQIRAIDMFPHTPHVELVAALKRV